MFIYKFLLTGDCPNQFEDLGRPLSVESDYVVPPSYVSTFERRSPQTDPTGPQVVCRVRWSPPLVKPPPTGYFVASPFILHPSVFLPNTYTFRLVTFFVV